MTGLVFTMFIVVLYISSQNILKNALNQQFLAQTTTFTELARNELKPHVLAEDFSALKEAADAILALEQVHFIRVYFYEAPVIELHSQDYPQRELHLDNDLFEIDDGLYDVEYLLDISGTPVGKVQMSFSIGREQAEIRSAKKKLALSAVGMMGLGLWILWLLTGRLSARIKVLERASNEFASGQRDISLPLSGKDEIAATARAFQSMMWQIREKYAAMNLSPDGILLISANQRITHTNEALVSILGERAANLTGKPFSEFKRLLKDVLVPDESQAIECVEDIHTQSELTVEVPEHKILRCIHKSVQSPSGDSFSEVFYFRDITQESEVDRMKSEFLTTAAHELRTPLASVMGFSELLMNNNYDINKVKLIAETINRQSVNLKHLVDDLLDIARIEARGSEAMNLSVTTAQAVVDECCEVIAGEDTNCELFFDKHDCVWPRIRLDESKIKQALMNILSNAFKYSEDNGMVVVDTVQHTHESGDTWFGIRVTDQGIGMNQEQLARVGEKFYRADNTGSIQGTGLGVALTSEILALHNGHIEITSQLGQGTQVTLWIPVSDDVETALTLAAH